MWSFWNNNIQTTVIQPQDLERYHKVLKNILNIRLLNAIKSETEIFSSTPLDSSQHIRERLEKVPKRDTFFSYCCHICTIKSLIFFEGKL